MIQELQTGILDINNKYDIDFSCKQLDDIILKIIIYDKSLPADLSNYNCRLKAFKADQVPLIQNTNIAIKDNIVTIKADKQLTTTTGIVKAELQFLNKTTLEKKSTFYLEIKVVASVLDVDGVVSTPTCTILEEIDNKLDQIEDIKLDIIEAVKVKNDLNTSRTDANNMNNTLKTTTTNADNKKKEVETVINNASNKIKEVQDSTNTASTTKKEVDSSVLQANASKQALDTSKVNADNTKKEVDAAIIVADEKIEIIKKLDPENVVEDVENLKKQVLESTYTKIETDSTLTKLESCKDSFVHNMQIKGKTLQNLATMKTVVFDNFKTILNIVKPLTDYTFKFDIATNSCQINYKWLLQDGKYSEETMFISKSDSNTVLVKKLTSPVNAKELVIWNITSGVKAGDLDNLLILEGDWTGKETPPYFQGIKSVGELEGNKISILTTGKNLIGGIELGGLGTSGEPISSQETSRTKKFIKVKENNNYKLSGLSTNASMICYFDSNKQLTRIAYDITSITTKTNETYLKIRFNKTSIPQLEEGTTTTTYEDYKEDKTEILLPSPHLGLPNGVADVIYFDRNTRTRNVEVTTLDTLDPSFWNVTATDITTPNTIEFQHNLATASSDSYILTDRFNFYEADWLWSKDIEGIGINNKNKNLQLRINKSRLETPNSAGLNKWLKENKTLLIYQLATPVIEKLNIKDTLQTFQDGYIQLDNAITPSTHLEYSTNIPSAIGGLTKVVDHSVDEITNIESTISDINIELGDEPLKTTSETIRGAINENTKNIDNKFNRCTSWIERDINPINLECGHYMVEGNLKASNGYPIDGYWNYSIIVSGDKSDTAQVGHKKIILIERIGTVYIKTQDSDIWSQWKQLATTDYNGFGKLYINGNEKDISNANSKEFYATNVFDSSNAPSDSWYHIINLPHGNNDGFTSQIAVSYGQFENNIYFRGAEGTKWLPWKELATTENTQLTLLNGWLPYDVQPMMAVCGKLMTINMRIKSGVYTSGTWIADTGKIPTGGGSYFFPVIEVDGTKVGSVAITNTGRIEIVGAFNHNADISINFTVSIN
ncbi:pyocin knob domain-containing protein [Clostridium sp. ZBS17]|uniref:pyocin knob domain-containing protein n=1 Tax=Clostridium sp. ZBS17 TaxID=2949968 RepID=UPI002079847F|nr:pyocin knob domain-containing protein [Clostridium sp. ZBS17]